MPIFIRHVFCHFVSSLWDIQQCKLRFSPFE